MPDITHDVDILGAGFGDQLRESFRLSGDPEDRVLTEMGCEVDRLEEMLKKDPGVTNLKPSVKANIVARRMTGLKLLSEMIRERRDFLEREGGSTLVANLVLKLQIVLDGLGLQKDVKQAVVNNLLIAVEQAEKDKKI